MTEARFLDDAPCCGHVIVIDHDPARQDAELTLDHAHVVVEHLVADAGAITQGADRRDQHGVVGADQFTQDFTPDTVAACRPKKNSALK